MSPISAASRRVLGAVETFVREYGRPPTLRETAREAGVRSTWTVRYHLRRLEQAGLLRMQRRASRGVVLVRDVNGIPVIGTVSAGTPMEAIENVEGYISMRDLVPEPENMFALRVKGDSMVGAGIFAGDLVFVRKQQVASPGEIVAARLGDEAVVKRLIRTEGQLWLASENPAYQPIPADGAHILGRVVAIVRRYCTPAGKSVQ